jgi:hypothetical protein
MNESQSASGSLTVLQVQLTELPSTPGRRMAAGALEHPAGGRERIVAAVERQ